MDPADLLGALVRGAFAGKPRKRSAKALRFLTGGSRGSIVNAGTMLTAAGVAWGLYETWQNSQVGQAASGGQWGGGNSTPASTPAVSVPPIPAVPSPSDAPSAGVSSTSSEVLRLVRLTISAARADGSLGAEEREAILMHARSVGAESVVLAELERSTPLDQIVAGIADPRERDALYVLAFSIVRADESVSGAERIYLAQLAAYLGLDAATTARLEQQATRGIDAQDEPR